MALTTLGSHTLPSREYGDFTHAVVVVSVAPQVSIRARFQSVISEIVHFRASIDKRVNMG